MSDTELEHLIQMANQIAVNFSFHADAEDRVLDHLTRFWAPSMRGKLLDYHAGGGHGLQRDVRAALQQLSGT